MAHKTDYKQPNYLFASILDGGIKLYENEYRKSEEDAVFRGNITIGKEKYYFFGHYEPAGTSKSNRPYGKCLRLDVSERLNKDVWKPVGKFRVHPTEVTLYKGKPEEKVVSAIKGSIYIEGVKHDIHGLATPMLAEKQLLSKNMGFVSPVVAHEFKEGFEPPKEPRSAVPKLRKTPNTIRFRR